MRTYLSSAHMLSFHISHSNIGRGWSVALRRIHALRRWPSIGMVVLHYRRVVVLRLLVILRCRWGRRRRNMWQAIGVPMVGMLHVMGLLMWLHTVWRRRRGRRILARMGGRGGRTLLVGGVVGEGAVHGRGRGMFGTSVVVGVVRVVFRALTWLVGRMRRRMVEGRQALRVLRRTRACIGRLDGRQRRPRVVLRRRRSNSSVVIRVRLRRRRMGLRRLLGLRVGGLRRTVVYGRGRLLGRGVVRMVRLRSRRMRVRRSPAVHDDGDGRAMRQGSVGPMSRGSRGTVAVDPSRRLLEGQRRDVRRSSARH